MNPSTIIKDAEGNVLSMTPCTAIDPRGTRARDADGRALDGPAEHNLPPSLPRTPVEDIVAAIQLLDRADAALWTTRGKPRVEAIEHLLQQPITFAERDVAWSLAHTRLFQPQPE